MMKNIFLIGGGGYVGSALVPKLLELGYNVAVYDLFIYGKEVLENHKNLSLIKGDVRDLKLLETKLKGFDFIIHLACIKRPSFD